MKSSTVRIEGELFDLSACSKFAEASCCAPDKRSYIFRTGDGRFFRLVATDLGRIDHASMMQAEMAARVRQGWSTLWPQP